MKIKRILAVLLAAVLALSLCSCELAEKLTAYGLYAKAVKTLEEAGGFEANGKISIGFESAGISMDMDMHIKQNGERIATEVGLFGITATTTYIDGFVYMETLGQKIKYSVPEEDKEQFTQSAGTAGMFKLGEESFDSDVVVNEDGTKSVVVNVPAEILQDALASAGTEDITFDTVVCTFNFDESNTLASVLLTCDAKYNIMDASVNGKVSVEYNFVNFGTAPTVEVPEGDYKDGGSYTDIIG